MQSPTLDLGKRLVHRLRHLPDEARARRRRERVERVLARSDARTYDSDELFEALQREYPPRPEYGYDALSTWWRGVRRAHWLMPLAGIEAPGARVLDVACGDGMAGRALTDYGHEVALTDVEDWREPRARALEFVQADVAQGIPLESGRFDVVVSYNAFIHFENPAGALAEMLRLCRPGGVVHLDFGFLWPSAWGLHAYRTVRMPWAHFLFSPEFLARKLDALGFDAWPAELGKPRAGLIPLNGWRLERYRAAFAATGCETVAASTTTDERHLDVVERFPGAFAGRGLTYEDLVTTLCSVTLRKPAEGADRNGAAQGAAASRTASNGSPRRNGAAG